MRLREAMAAIGLRHRRKGLYSLTFCGPEPNFAGISD